MVSGTKEELPPELSDLQHRLNEIGRLFIELYECVKERMQAITSKLRNISKEVKEMHEGANRIRMIGGARAGLEIAVGVGAAFLAGVSSAGERAANMAARGRTAAIVGSASVITANAIKAVVEPVCKVGKRS